MKRIRWIGAALSGGLALAATSTAWASSAIEYPDNGVAAFSRSGAWLATATDPVAGYYNPAALSLQPTALGIGANITFQKICFDREDKTAPTAHYPDGYPLVCNSNSNQPNVIPNLAFTWRVNEKLGVGLTVVPPSSYGTLTWDDTTPTNEPPFGTSPHAPGGRYLSLGVKGTILLPTLAAGYSITDRLHVGAGFVAGIAILELQSMSMGLVSASDLHDNPQTDTHSKLTVKDMFVPGFVLSGLYEATDNIDIAAWYRWSDKIKAQGDLEVLANYYGANANRSTRSPDVTRSQDQVGADAAKVTITVPMEARLSARWHMPRKGVTPLEREGFRKDTYRTRDPLRDDLYDTELELTWANNSAADVIQIRFPEGGIGVNGAANNVVPANADRPTGYKDTFGARLGLQYNILVNKLGVRAGTWVETSANDAKYLTTTGVPSLRGGFGGGVVFRVASVDLEAGYQHHWSAGFDNNGVGAIRAIAGTGSPDNRSYHAVNGGKVTQYANVVALGAVIHF